MCIKANGIADAETEDTKSLEEMVRRLEQSGSYRIMRKLVPRIICEAPNPYFTRVGLILDTETTGLNCKFDEIIEIGVVAFTYSDEGQFGGVIGSYEGLNQPSKPIPAAITKLTGIDDDMVSGRQIDLEILRQLVVAADLIIAHKASFDRPFCEKLLYEFGTKSWACSVTEIDWGNRGYEGTKLSYLLGQSGYFHEGHRAIDDCHALLEVLVRGESPTPFSELIRTSAKESLRIWAKDSPFDMKDKLKARGYRWSDGSDGGPRSWWIDAAPETLDDEIHFLRTEIYKRSDAQPVVNRKSAMDRYRAS